MLWIVRHDRLVVALLLLFAAAVPAMIGYVRQWTIVRTVLVSALSFATVAGLICALIFLVFWSFARSGGM